MWQKRYRHRRGGTDQGDADTCQGTPRIVNCHSNCHSLYLGDLDPHLSCLPPAYQAGAPGGCGWPSGFTFWPYLRHLLRVSPNCLSLRPLGHPFLHSLPLHGNRWPPLHASLLLCAPIMALLSTLLCKPLGERVSFLEGH